MKINKYINFWLHYYEKKMKEQTEAGTLELQSSSPLLVELLFSILEWFFERCIRASVK